MLDEIEKETPYIAINLLKLCKSAANYAKHHTLISVNIFNNINHIAPPKTKKKCFTISGAMRILKECTVINNNFFPVLFC